MQDWWSGIGGDWMSTELLGRHGMPWTEAAYFALGETRERVELVDGVLLVSPSSSGRHQVISHRLTASLWPAADSVGLAVVEAVNVRLKPQQVVIPDLVVTSDYDKTTFEASEIALICEIVSPSRPSNDRVLKMHLYAEAKIKWYLLVEPADGLGITLRLYQLIGSRYVEQANASDDEVLRLTEPVLADLVPASLLPRRA